MMDDFSPLLVQYHADRIRRLRIVLIAVPAILGALLLMAVFGLGPLLPLIGFPTEYALLGALAAFSISGVTILMVYLQTGFSRDRQEEMARLEMQRHFERMNDALRHPSDTPDDEILELQSELTTLREEISSVKTSSPSLDQADRPILLAEMRQRLMEEASESLLSELRLKAADEFKLRSRDTELDRRFDDSRARLSLEISALGRRGNLNLALGIVTTVAGLVLLGVFVFAEIQPQKDIVGFTAHFVPRLTLVIFIELFAYFFLRLYKSSLAEIKYFQNELTNVEAKHIALRTALTVGDSTMTSDVVTKLGSTERNHILSKDQTTVELERARIDKESLSEITKHFSQLLPKRS